MREIDLAREKCWRRVWTMLLLLEASKAAAESCRVNAVLSTQTTKPQEVDDANQKCNQLLLHCCVRAPVVWARKIKGIEMQQHEIAVQFRG